MRSRLPSAPEAEYGDRELELLGGLAHQAKLAIANASSFAGLERTFLSTVEALANALEARDEYTSSHARWITDMAIRVGSELGLDGDTLKRLELGALFHDIGKIGIPNSVLLKPGPLSEEERLLIETHPELGEKIIAPIDQLQDVCGIVRACHERWDGQGYPDQKAGEEIPLEARIIFACDAFHAMTTDRPYRRALPSEEALRRLDGERGVAIRPAGRRRLPARPRRAAELSHVTVSFKARALREVGRRNTGPRSQSVTWKPLSFSSPSSSSAWLVIPGLRTRCSSGVYYWALLCALLGAAFLTISATRFALNHYAKPS